MAAPPPPDFLDLRTAWGEAGGPLKPSNIIGVCVDHLDPTRSRGSDWTCKFTLNDPSWVEGLGMPVRFFCKEEKNLPAIQNNGDIVIIQNLKMKEDGRGNKFGLSNFTTTWVVLDGASIAASEKEQGEDITFVKSEKAGCPSFAELQYAKYLYEWTDQSSFRPPAKATSLQVANIVIAAGGTAPKLKPKFSLIQDLMPPRTAGPAHLVFSDLVGEVRKFFKSETKVELYITDYTSHDLLFESKYGSPDEVEGDNYGYISRNKSTSQDFFSKMTMMICLWDDHAAYAYKQVQVGQYVSLRNVQIKMDRNGNQLEGHCRGNNYNRVDISILSPRECEGNSPLRELLRRKHAYEAKAKEKGILLVRHPATLIRKADAGPEGDTEENKKKKSKSQKKKEIKKMKARATTNNGPSDQSNSAETSMLTPVTNTSVRCMNHPVPIKSISAILDCENLKRKTPKGNEFHLPFQNCKYKSQIRVVDFLPDNIADFACPYRESDYDILSDHDDSDSEFELTCTDVKWEWRFFLVVEDASNPTGQKNERMELLVADEGGDFLLKMAACDLRKNPQQLALLKEKLFVLWGDLQERKEEPTATATAADWKPRSKPFECLIKEYGIPARDEGGEKKMGGLEFERMFRLWGTTVK